jgi:drug/metabolite transporter (DMT)-like permease
MPYIGELSALAAAFLWAMASIIYRSVGVKIPPLTLNAVKGVLSVALLGITMAVVRTQMPDVGWYEWSVLLGSGAIGIGLGDTAFFAALNRMGERRTVLTVETLAPPIAVVLGGVILREFLSVAACGGIMITLAGVAWVMSDKKAKTTGSGLLRKGFALGAIAAACQALGGVMSRKIVSMDGISPLWSGAVRLLGGLAFVMIALCFRREKVNKNAMRSGKVMIAVFTATFFGTFLAIFLQQLSLKHTNAAITQTLIATSAIFIIPFVAMRGEKISVRAIVGSLVALVGVVVLVVFK